ncbi:MAG: glycoside hydrolase family 16 protein [Candidatus Eremiobacteraeota bacterium]|nr:glycoside hydrolase family 16 protein [Candidatus Eremiobacteraeota bacterium]MCW5872477.1 glycoside hydrolase family 16 protein [Candidatus Eremiobacteraeota bacterium]
MFLLSGPLWAQPRLDQFAATPFWSDEFNTPGRPDPAKWTFQFGDDGWGNQELQNYTDRNARVADGLLTITATKEGETYTSSRIHSQGKGDFLYGRVVARARLPRGRGTWPAIWMLYSQDEPGRDGWPGNGEIDIMEHVGFDPGVIHGSIHSQAFNHIDHTQKTATMLIPDAESAFHDYELRWTPDWIETRIDDKPVLLFENPHKTWREWPFDRPQHLLLNVAVGGFWGGQKGIDDSIWPQSMEVDYVRVYAYQP